MKYLKRFESVEYLYSSMDDEKYEEYIKENKTVPFNPKYLSYIKNNLRNDVAFIEYNDRIGIILRAFDNKTISIDEYTDEWFIVSIECDDIMSSPYNPAYIYRLCDGFDGLKQCLSNEYIISTQ
jgi:hypothetical protein